MFWESTRRPPAYGWQWLKTHVNHPPFSLARRVHLNRRTTGIKQAPLVPVEKSEEPLEERVRVLSSCYSDSSSLLGRSKGVKPEGLFLLRPLLFLSDPFNILWAPVSGLEKRSRQGVAARCVKVAVWSLPFCQHFCNISSHCYSRAIFPAYRKEMNSQHLAFSLPSLASCDDVCPPASLW